MMKINTVSIVSRSLLVLALLSCGLMSRAQVSLPSTGTTYSENFDGMGASGTTPPTGWTTQTGASASSRGSSSGALSLNSTAATNGAFNNYPNGSGRCLGIRQTAAYGDPGAAFEVQIANTLNRKSFSMSISHVMLSVQPRSTVWSVQYSTNGTTWVTLGTYSDPSATTSTPVTYSFGSALDNLSGSVYIRSVALSATTGSGNRDSYGVDDFSLSWSPFGPDVNTPTAINIDSSFARLGAKVTSDQGSTITQRGIVWSLAANPQIGQPGVTTVPVSGTLGVFDTMVSGLPVGALVHMRGYATNVQGTSYTKDTTFYTLSGQPAAVTNLQATATSFHDIKLTWTRSPNAQGYVILQKMDAAPASFPQDRNRYTMADMIGDANVADTILSGNVDSVNFSGLISGTVYYYSVIPYRYNGTNIETYNYNTDPVVPISFDTTFGVSPSKISDLVVVSGYEPATISSVKNDTLNTDTNGTGVWKLSLRDGGSTLNDPDNMPTTIKRLVITKGSRNTNASWISTIRFAALFDDSTHQKIANATIYNDSMLFSGFSFSAADNNQHTFTLRVSLQRTAIHDNDTLHFRIIRSNLLTEPLTISSQIPVLDIRSDSSANRITVNASQIVITQQPVSINVNVRSAAGFIKAELRDANGNKDLDFPSPVSLFSSKASFSVTASGLPAVNGAVAFDSITFRSIARANVLKLYAAGLDTATSVTFNIFGSTASDIKATTGFAYTDSIPYLSFQEDSSLTTTNSVAVFGFTLRDGGASANDADTFATVMTNLTISVLQGSDYLRRVALYQGNTKIRELALTDTLINLPNILVSAPDNDSTSFVIRASFNNRYANNQRLLFRIKKADADTGLGSLFATVNAGGAMSSSSGANNILKYVDVSVTAPAAVNATVCKGSSARLTAVKNNSAPLKWYSSINATAAVFTGDTFFISVVSAPVTYYVQYDSAGWLSPRVPVSADLIRITAPVVSPLAICRNNSASLQVTATNPVSWYASFTATNAISTAANFNTGLIGNDTVFYVQADSASCSSPRVAFPVKVKNIAVPLVRDTQICKGSTVSLSAAPNGYTIRWYATATSATALNTGNTFPAGMISNDTVFYVLSDSAGCMSARVPVRASVRNITIPQLAATSLIACAGDKALLLANEPVRTIKWYATNTATTPLITNDSFETAALTTDITYYAEASENGCASSRVPVGIRVNPLPVLTVAATDSFCSGSSRQLTVAAQGAVIRWYDAADRSNLLATGAMYQSPVLTANTTYYVQAEKLGCYSAVTAYPLVAKTKPAIPTANNATTCSGKTVTLRATSPAGLKWFTALSDSTGITTTGDSLVTAAIMQNTSYYVSALLNGCFSDRKEVKITANPTPVPDFTINRDEQCLHNNQFVFVNAVNPANTFYQWDFGDTTGFGFSNPVKTYRHKGNFTVKLKVTSDKNCAAETSKAIRVTAPDADFTYTVSNGRTFTFQAVAPGVSSYKWNFTASDSSADAAPVFTFPAPGTYPVKLTVQDSKLCLAEVSRLVQAAAATGVEDLVSGYNMNVFPNPAQEQVTISYTLKQTTPVEVNVFDVTGRLVKKLPAEIQAAGDRERSFGVQDMNPGLYFLQVEMERVSTTLRLEVK